MATVRIPLAAPYNTRVSAVNASDATSGYVGVGIVGQMIVGKTTQASDKDARFVNCFPHSVSDLVTGKSRKYIVKRPGFGTQSTPASGKKGYAVMVWTGSGGGTSVISAFDTPNSTIYNGTNSLGAVTGVCTGITETFVSTTPTLTITTDSSKGYYYDTGSGLVEITDAQFPGAAGKTLVGTFCHMDGFAFILTQDGQLWASDVNSVSAWTASAFGSTNIEPDQGIGAVRWKNFILAFGRTTMEPWYNVGLSPFPLARANAMVQKVGAVHADAIAQIADVIWFCGAPTQGGLSIFQWDGQLSRVSTPEIDSAILLAGASNITLSTLRFYGLSFLLVKAGPLTYVYCPEEKLWHEWSSTTPLWTKTAATSVGGTMVNYAVSNVSTAGKVFLMNQASLVFTDNGTAYTARVQLPKMDLGTGKMKFWNSAELIADRETSTSAFTLSKSDDDFQTFDVLRSDGDLSAARNIFHMLGASNSRGWVITHAAATPMRAEALELEVEVGLN